MRGVLVQRRAWEATYIDAHGIENDRLAQPVDVVALGFEPAGADEEWSGGERRVSSARLYLPFDAEVDPRDRWVVFGLTYAVEGESQAWVNPYTGREAGRVLALRRVTG